MTTSSNYQVGQRVLIQDEYSGFIKGGTVLSISKTGKKINVAVDGFKNPDGKGHPFYVSAGRSKPYSSYAGYLSGTQAISTKISLTDSITGEVRCFESSLSSFSGKAVADAVHADMIAFFGDDPEITENMKHEAVAWVTADDGYSAAFILKYENGEEKALISGLVFWMVK